MAKQLQLRRGTTAEHASFTGAVGEVTVDSDKDTIVVHDGYTIGGIPMLRQDVNNLADQAIPVNKLIKGTANQLLRTNSAGTGVEWFTQPLYDATLLYSRSATTSAYTATLSQPMTDFNHLIFQCSEWQNILYIPVEIFKNTSGTIMLATYDTYHSYVSYVNDTTINVTAGQGNTMYKCWGML